MWRNQWQFIIHIFFQHDGNTILQYFLWKYSNMFNEKFKYTFSMVGCCGSGTSAPTLATDLKPGQVKYFFEAGSGTIFIWSRVRYNIYPGTAVQYVQHGRLCSRYIYIHQVQLQRNSTSLNSDRLTHLLTCLPYLFCQFCIFWC